MARCTHNAGGVAFVHHNKRIVLLCEVANLVDGSHVAVHREHTVGDDDAETLFLRFLQAAFEVGHVSVCIAVTLSLAEAHAVDDAGMVERVGDDGVLCGEERFEHAAVGIKASGIENGVLSVEVVGNGCFKFLVRVLRAADEAYARHAVAATVHHVLGGLHEAGVVGKAKVVVGAEIEYFAVGHVNGSLLRSFDEPFALVKPGVLDGLQLFLKMSLEICVHIYIVGFCLGKTYCKVTHNSQYVL